jgi:ferric-dicitrate binding protein FerR (iron transport regulator)
MASRRKQVAKAVPFNAADLAAVTKATPYIQRLIQDSDLRNNIRTAYESSKSAYDRLQSAKQPQKAVLEDKRLQKDVRKAAEALREASSALTEAPKKRRKGGIGRKLLLLVVGAGVALAVSEKLRSKVLDTLFGAEEEFQYTPPTASPTPPPASPVTAA